MAKLLSGTALITGAASGIGYHTALSFAKYGMDNLALADVDPGALSKSAKAVRDLYPAVQVLELTMDVRKTDEVQAGFAALVGRFGRLDVAVHNAGILGPAGATAPNNNDEKDDDDAWANTLDINLSGVRRCQREALRVMLAQDDRGPREGRGRIVNTASVWGLQVPPRGLTHTPYIVAKHGVVGLTKADAVVYGPQGIRMNAICPGYTETPLIDGFLENPALKHEIERSAVSRLGRSEEVADAIVFLASPLSSFMHGASMVVDGGL